MILLISGFCKDVRAMASSMVTQQERNTNDHVIYDEVMRARLREIHERGCTEALLLAYKFSL